MVTDGPNRNDPDDIDARFEEIVAGLRAEESASRERRREAIRRARTQQRSRPAAPPNRPLEGGADPNPWPPKRRTPPGTNPPVTEPLFGPAGRTPSGTNPPVTGNTPGTADRPAPADSGAAPRGADGPATRGRGAAGSASADWPSAGRHREDSPGPRHTDSGRVPRFPDAQLPSTPSEGWRSWEESDEEEHFIPPNPPLPAGDLHLWSIVVGLLGGPIILILSNVFTLLRAPWWTPVGIVVSMAGVVLLILRLPKHRDYTDSSGGAQV